MRLLMTGMTSRTAGCPESSFSRLLRDELDAESRYPRVGMDLSDYDAVLVGLGSPLAPSANHTFGALSVLHQAVLDGKLAGVFLDDPNFESVAQGARSVLRDPTRLQRGYFSKRHGYEMYLGSPATRTIVLNALSYLLNDDIPKVIYPAFSWSGKLGLASRIADAFPNTNTFRPIDPTPLLLNDKFTEVPTQDVQRTHVSVRTFAELVAGSPTTFPITPRTRLLASDAGTPDDVSYVWSVLEGPVIPAGWWVPTPVQAANAGTLYGTVGDQAYYLNWGGFSYSRYEDMTLGERAQAITDQREFLKGQTWDRQTLATYLRALIGVPSS